MTEANRSVNFPIFEHLRIEGYDLYPGESEDAPGLQIQFGSGLTLILGANGLGKTTLVTVMFRMMTGPYDISGLFGQSDLGGIELRPSPLRASRRSALAQRVVDGARSAIASLQFRLGDHVVLIERRLNDLALLRLVIDGVEEKPDEENFQNQLPKLVGVWSFGDWILLLRYLVFYFEERRALIWDASAQRQILRFLLLSPETAGKWTSDERAILELDSRYRNLNAVVSKETRVLGESENREREAESTDVRAELETLESLQQIDAESRTKFLVDLADADDRRQSARLRKLKAEQEREARYREVERAKLTAIEARFPDISDTARYIFVQLMSNEDCIACGNHVPAVAVSLEGRIQDNKCIVCGSDISQITEQSAPVVDLSEHRFDKLMQALTDIDMEVHEARRELHEAEQSYTTTSDEIIRLDSELAARSARIQMLVLRLPPDATELHQQREELASLRGRAESLRNELSEKRQAFQEFIESESRAMVTRAEAIRTAFGLHAEGFLFEDCELAWSPKRALVGQSGARIEFPSFDLDMTGASFLTPVRRSGPDQVSESQREFIDLAFRMALIDTVGSGGVGTLVIDAPESSLDAVFVTQAAAVLGRFAEPSKGNRLVITSNLVEGRLIPTLLKKSSDNGKEPTIVNLFDLAEPTAAVRMMRDEYQQTYNRIVGLGSHDST